MTDFTDELTSNPVTDEDAVSKRRAAFSYANASLALEGLFPDEAQLARQEEVIQGRLTTEQAIAQCLAEARGAE